MTSLSKPRFDDDLYFSLPEVNAGRNLATYVMDEETSPKKFTRTLSVGMTPEMYQAIQELATNKNLPFNGVMNNLGRHAFAAFIDSVDNFLEEDMKTIWRSLMTQQRRLTRERVIVSIDDIIDQQVEQLRFWSHRSKWNEVKRGLARFRDELDGYPNAEWREHAADTWLHHDGVKRLMQLWSTRLVEESPGTWQAVREFTDAMEAYANV